MKKFVAFVLVMVMVFTFAASAMADPQKSKQIFYSVPIYDENNTAYMTRSENNDTLYYQFISDTVFRSYMRVGSVDGASVRSGEATVRFTSTHTEKGYCPTWSNTISYSGSVTYSSSTHVTR